MRRSTIKVNAYGYENEVINKYIGDDVVWMVNGERGRRPIWAVDAEQAIDKYIEKYAPNDFDEEDVQ